MTESSADPTRTARAAYTLNAVVAWTGVALTAFFSGMGWYDVLPHDPGLFGSHPAGAAGSLGRLSDTFSYFTIWSNVVVALSATLVAAQPRRDTLARRVLRLDALLMITVTAIVYQVLLAPTAVITGWSRLTDPILHVVTPALTVLVWLVWGPRGQVTGRVVQFALAVPLLWIGYTLLRGAVIDAYPYDFVNVVERGYPAVAQTLALILVFGMVVAAVFWGLEVARRPRRGEAREAEEAA